MPEECRTHRPIDNGLFSTTSLRHRPASQNSNESLPLKPRKNRVDPSSDELGLSRHQVIIPLLLRFLWVGRDTADAIFCSKGFPNEVACDQRNRLSSSIVSTLIPQRQCTYQTMLTNLTPAQLRQAANLSREVFSDNPPFSSRSATGIHFPCWLKHTRFTGDLPVQGRFMA